jgi:hypothetical protein
MIKEHIISPLATAAFAASISVGSMGGALAQGTTSGDDLPRDFTPAVSPKEVDLKNDLTCGPQDGLTPEIVVNGHGTGTAAQPYHFHLPPLY